jgi:AcrR family transcriptional regulator
VADILDAAATLFAATGYEATTTNAVAAQAGVPIGSLYRYFPDKRALLGALAERHSRELRALLERVLDEGAASLPLPALIDRLVDPFVAMHVGCPAYAHLVVAADASRDLAEATRAAEGELVERLARFLQRVAPRLSLARARTVARVCKATVKALIAPPFAAAQGPSHRQVVAETKRMLLAYLRATS